MPEYFGKPNPDEVSKKGLQDLVNEGAIVETSLTSSQEAWLEEFTRLNQECWNDEDFPKILGAGGSKHNCRISFGKHERQVDKDAAFAAQEAALRAELREFMSKEGPDESQAGS